MNEQEFKESIKKKMTESISELNPFIEKIVSIIADVYEKGFWTGFNIGTSVELNNK